VIAASWLGGCAHSQFADLRPPAEIPSPPPPQQHVVLGDVTDMTSPDPDGVVTYVVIIPGHFDVAGQPVKIAATGNCDLGPVTIDGKIKILDTRVGERDLYEVECKQPPLTE
jgi:hypothetical protein